MAEGSSDPPDLNPNGTSHEKPHQHKSRRGRSRHNNDRNLSSNSYDPSQQYGHFNQSSNPPFSHNNSNYVEHQHPPYQGEDGARRGGRGRGRREGNRSVNGSFGGSNSRWQRPGSDYGPHSGSNRSMGGYHSGAYPMDGPDRPNWRRDDSSRNLEQTNEDQDVRVKKPRKFSQEQRRREQNKKESHLKEDNTSAEHQRSDETKGENHSSENRERSQRSRIGPDSQRDNHQRKQSEAKRRQGPIKPPRPPSTERGAGGQDHSNHNRPSQDPPVKLEGVQDGHKPKPKGGGDRTIKTTDLVQGAGTRCQRARRHRQLSEEKYECMVCCDVIRLMAPVWSCQSCFHVFHLNCIKKWARSPASQADDSAEGWRCPACQHVVLKQPTSYTCFCGKVTNPEWQRTEIPHSCGDMCGKKRSGVDCNHPSCVTLDLVPNVLPL
ncbi:hypothetical protein INR49_012017 [Caranx melampygus]|nr:hypothetical protein INR49_012017 [Caranx melampygus]